MKNLWKNLFERKNYFNEFSADRIKPIFESLGIDIETIGFPLIETRHDGFALEAYFAHFKNVNFKPIKTEKGVSILVKGEYITQAKASYKSEEDGLWHPGGKEYYSFTIKDNKLKIKQRR